MPCNLCHMNKIFFLGGLTLSLLLGGGVSARASDEEAKVWNETIQSPEGNFQVKIDSKKRKVEVVSEKPPGKSGHLRVRILRHEKRPIEVRLHLTEKPEDPFRYTGKADRWNGSLVGFELEWSFDRKTWKKLGKSLKRIVP